MVHNGGGGGRSLKPLPERLLTHWSPIDLVSNDYSLDKFQLTIDLLAPSINIGIGDELTTLRYSSWGHYHPQSSLRGAFLWPNMDIKSAYRQLPVHPDDQGLLAIWWGRVTFIDTALACALPQSFLQQWQIVWLGQCGGRGYAYSLMTTFLSLLQTHPSARSGFTWWFPFATN